MRGISISKHCPDTDKVATRTEDGNERAFCEAAVVERHLELLRRLVVAARLEDVR